MNKENVTLEQVVNLAISSVEESQVAIVAMLSIADAECVNTLVERLEQPNLKLIRRLD
ncbi:hypothetical protein [Bacillus cereus]|uniref:hypothetical protein n=1 Tax=Bacillus cereus TaxID=1396 RepID=UPI003980802B